MNKQSAKYIKENIPYYGKLGTATERGKDALAKKAWTITSQYVRMRDFIQYRNCVSCKKAIQDWRDTDPAHYHSFAGNGALSGFNLMNIHMSCKHCNGFRGAAAGHEMAEEIKKRYGDEIINELYQVKLQSVRADDWFYIGVIENVYKLFVFLKETYPDYDYPEYV